MSAEVELLRHAAFHMRERAWAATPGPWGSTENSDGQHLVFDPDRSMDVEVCSFDARTVNLLRQGADAAHIASWHPAVALAVADLMDHAANSLEHTIARMHAQAVPPDYAAALYEPSLKVAREYLGERAEDSSGSAQQDSGLCPGCRHESEHRYDVGCVARKGGRRCGCRYDARACREVSDAS